MNFIDKDPNGYSPGDVVQRLRNCISSGIEGIDYTIIPRDKNEKLLADYCLSSKRRIEILKSLSVEDYVKWEHSNNPKFNALVYFFEKSVNLTPRYVEDAKEKPVDLYIKITWDNNAGNVLVIISFHEKEY